MSNFRSPNFKLGSCSILNNELYLTLTKTDTPDLIYSVSLEYKRADLLKKQTYLKIKYSNINSLVKQLEGWLECDRELALNAGCNDYVTQPFREDDLFAKMAEYLRLRYVYADSDRQKRASHHYDEQASLSSLTSESLSVMPEAWIHQLHHAALLCDDEELFHLLEQISSEHLALITYLNYLATNFSFQFQSITESRKP